MNVLQYNDSDWLFSKEAFTIYASCMYRSTFEAYQAQMARYVSDPSVKVFVCERKRKAVGILVLSQSDSDATILGIAVSEKDRRQGIGRHMIRRAMECEQLDRIHAQTDDDAIGFYRKCGFSERRIVMDYPNGKVVRYNCALTE